MGLFDERRTTTYESGMLGPRSKWKPGHETVREKKWNGDSARIGG